MSLLRGHDALKSGHDVDKIFLILKFTQAFIFLFSPYFFWLENNSILSPYIQAL
jgi:hypothetical protein